MYVISLLGTISIFFLVAMWTGGSWENFGAFIDLPSFLGPMLASVFVLAGSSHLKDFARAFTMFFSPKKDFAVYQVRDAADSVSLVIKTLFCAAGFIIAVSVTLMLCDMRDYTRWGPNIGLSLMSFCYACFFSLLLLPVLYGLRKMLNSAECSLR